MSATSDGIGEDYEFDLPGNEPAVSPDSSSCPMTTFRCKLKADFQLRSEERFLREAMMPLIAPK